MTRPNEPTLTCSEVVERLHDCIEGPDYWFDTDKATAILHSWRERRVQELEESLRRSEERNKELESKIWER